MAAFPACTITFSMKADHCNGGAIPGTDTATAFSDDSVAEIKAFLARYASGTVTVTQA